MNASHMQRLHNAFSVKGIINTGTVFKRYCQGYGVRLNEHLEERTCIG